MTPGNTGSGYEDETSDPLLHAMVDRARENYKAGKNDPLQSSLHTIAYTLALHELRTWQVHTRLERIAQALESSLRGETITRWQAIESLWHWAMTWERERLAIQDGKLAPFDILWVSYQRDHDRWKASFYSHTSQEMFDIFFQVNRDLEVIILRIEKLPD